MIFISIVRDDAYPFYCVFRHLVNRKISVMANLFLSQNTLKFLGLAFYATFQGSRRFSLFIIIFASGDDDLRSVAAASFLILEFDIAEIFGKCFRLFLLTFFITEIDSFANFVAESVISEEHITLRDEQLYSIL